MGQRDAHAGGQEEVAHALPGRAKGVCGEAEGVPRIIGGREVLHGLNRVSMEDSWLRGRGERPGYDGAVWRRRQACDAGTGGSDGAEEVVPHNQGEGVSSGSDVAAFASAGAQFAHGSFEQRHGIARGRAASPVRKKGIEFSLELRNEQSHRVSLSRGARERLDGWTRGPRRFRPERRRGVQSLPYSATQGVSLRMSNIEAVNALLTAINFDRFAEIEARHNPDVVFNSFRGPILHSSTAVEEWHHEFLRDYADCNYSELEYIEQDDTVAVRATIEAKGDDWRAFTQRVVEVLSYEGEGISERRLYGMLPDLELDKAETAAMTNATGFRGGSVSATKTAVTGFFGAMLKGDHETALTFLHDKAALIDTVYGTTTGPQNVIDLFAKIPAPLFGVWRVTRTLCGAKDALVEMAIDPARPRAAHWVRVVDGKVAVIESYWMFREIGVNPRGERRKRHVKQVILPK